MADTAQLSASEKHLQPEARHQGDRVYIQPLPEQLMAEKPTAPEGLPQL
jgi:hypothetical protein